MSDAKTDELKGRIKEAAGAVTDNDDLKNEGKADQVTSDIKGKVDDVKDKVTDAVDKVKDKLTKD